MPTLVMRKQLEDFLKFFFILQGNCCLDASHFYEFQSEHNHFEFSEPEESLNLSNTIVHPPSYGRLMIVL